ncbi:MAG: hypothetical protein HY300_00445 [Verrucomicrobia bacterium]|nr:hypothetical protein [Verrucomicrobiota bacterium]
MPSGFAESESNHSPPNTASSATVIKSVISAAYTISDGSMSTCAPIQCRRPPGNASTNTVRNAAHKMAMVWRPFIG